MNKIFCFLFVLIFSATANAALIDNGSYTTDTSTGLEWLDLTQTEGLSYNDVNSQLGAGGLYEGWRYATAVEVTELFNSAGGSGSYVGSSVANDGVVYSLLSLWGMTNIYAPDNYYFSGFIMGDPIPESIAPEGVNPDDYRLYGYAENDDLFYLGEDDIFIHSGYVPLTLAKTGYGSALVREASVVPVPAAAWLFGSGLIALTGISRRKAS